MTTLAQPFPTPPVGEDIVVVREKLKVTHLDPNSRRTYRELSLRNDSGETRHEVLLVMQDVAGLWVEDGEGRELAYLSNEPLEMELGPRQEILARLDPERDVSETAILLVLFAAPLPPRATLVLRLHYWDRESQGSHWYDVIPKHHFEQAKSKSNEYFDTAVEIEAPPDSRIHLIPQEGMPLPPEVTTPEGVRQSARSNFLQVHIPAGHPDVRFRYRLAPLRSELWLTKTAYHALWSIPLLMLVLAASGLVQLKSENVVAVAGPQGDLFLQVAENNAGELTATLGIAGIVSIVAFLRPVWTNRALYLWPLSCNLLLLAVTLAQP